MTWFLFHGNSGFGLSYDEVQRTNNVIPLLRPEIESLGQENSSVSVFGFTIPLTYKTYISTAMIPLYLPLGLFQDWVVGLRALYAIYTFLGAATGFLLFRRLWYWPAVVVPLLALTSPLIYPEIAYGFVTVLHFVPLLCAGRLFAAYLRKNSLKLLFGAAFLTGLAMNFTLYIAWSVFGLGVAFIIVAPKRAGTTLFRGWNPLVILSGAAIGMFNYVYYNVTEGFPSVRHLLVHLIPGKGDEIGVVDGLPVTRDAFGELGRKLARLYEILNAAAPAVVGLCIVVGAVHAAVLVVVLRDKSWSKYRWLFLPGLATVIGCAAVLLSPDTTRAGHYGMLTGLGEAAVVCTFVMALRAFGGRVPVLRRKLTAGLLAGVLVTGGALYSRASVDAILREGGFSQFSSAVFGFLDYVVSNGVSPDELLEVQWGTSTQLFFVTKGNFRANDETMVRLMEVSAEERPALIAEAVQARGGEMLVPLYLNGPFPEMKDAVLGAARLLENRICLEAEFARADGQVDMVLYRLGGRDSALGAEGEIGACTSSR
ncbi:MAG: hypothetical protein LBJ08_07315 [Bifidobacteriaceae bacterium]|jgi:hypothetical protein|nr:hypothetical protein [Bifidobacteriaceae bacterium]